jgi:MFS family permease
MVAGGAGMAVAALMLTGLSPTTAAPLLLGSYFLFGVGLGFENPPITNTAMSGMPAAQAGVAAGIASTSRQVGVTLGVAVIGAISGGAVAGSGIGQAFASDTHVGWWIIVGLGTLIVIGGYLSNGAWAQRTARRTAETLEQRQSRRDSPLRPRTAPEPS